MTGLYLSNRECTVRIGEDEFAVVDWSGEPPQVGAVQDYEVVRHIRSHQVLVLHEV
ncbi:hypothetical protein EV646_101145 [Kribbella antiqua]|uniref:Uncharacterized protein n=1 Tax=Kribbella antiqua TaxID=2512217 RepID=A0A4R2J157_9ACTN|nr:hypothetical protein [Kribbella antiqua]TCO51162.1 hypothetical protein EV646_101145 [Kribbella antiqua]